MEQAGESRMLIIDQNQDIGHFDADICDQQTLPTSTELPQQPIDKELANQIDLEIQKSKTNFFNNVKILEQITNNQNNLKKRTLKKQNIIVMQGQLEKKYQNNIFFKWNTRYAVLTQDKLYLFEDNKRRKVTSCFNFKILPTVILSKTTDTIIKIQFNNQCQQLILRAQNNGMKNKWYKELETVIKSHQKSDKLYLMTNHKEVYEQKDTISQQQFYNTAETGDILLFLTDHIGGKLQRFFTNSDYDHVAMVVRLNGDLMVFEANTTHGVQLYNWRKFIRYFNLYKKVSFRKLKSWRKKQLHCSLLQFAKKNIGRKYDMGAYKLLLKQQSNFDWDQQKQRGYFCSQLIAKALKAVGLIEPVRACSRYWPVDFSSNGNIKLIGGSLNNQQAIVLNKHTK